MKSITKLSWFFLLGLLVVACKPSGDKAETSEAGEAAETSGVSYNVMPEGSMVMWIGSGVGKQHNGTVNVSKGIVSMEDGKLTGGKFNMDMTSIVVKDLEGDRKGYLESHLKGLGDDNANDFFNTKSFPNSTFEITKATQLLNDENANYIINGNLTIKDVTKQVSFKAQVNENDGMISVTTPQFTIDRTEWGIKYGSSTFFDDLKDKAIGNDIGFQINLAAKS